MTCCERTTSSNKKKNKKTTILKKGTNSRVQLKLMCYEMNGERWFLNISSGENCVLGLFHQRLNSSACGGVMDEVIKIMKGTLKLLLSVPHPF